MRLAAWASIASSMESGVSWSGSERNRAWINLGDGTFADVSAVAGFDQIEDGRVVLRTDWDGDGDEDLWLRSRNGPTLRYLENAAAGGSTVDVLKDPAVELSALSVTVKDKTGGTRKINLLQGPTTDGYLASSAPVGYSARLRDDEVVERFSYQWGNGAGSMAGSNLGRRFRVTAQRSIESMGAVERRKVALAEGALESGPLPQRVVLRTPLPLPVDRVAALRTDASTESAILLIATGAGDAPSDLDVDGMHVVDTSSQSESRHGDFLAAVCSAVFGPGTELNLPLAALIDGDGTLQVLYAGMPTSGVVAQDRGWFVTSPVKGAERTTVGTPGAGARWFHGAPRSYDTLIQELRRAGLDADANAYSGAPR